MKKLAVTASNPSQTMAFDSLVDYVDAECEKHGFSEETVEDACIDWADSNKREFLEYYLEARDGDISDLRDDMLPSMVEGMTYEMQQVHPEWKLQ